jgi:hypothetical protein
MAQETNEEYLTMDEMERLRAEIKTVHELLDTNGVGHMGSPLISRVSDVVAEWTFLCQLRESFQKVIWEGIDDEK